MRQVGGGLGVVVRLAARLINRIDMRVGRECVNESWEGVCEYCKIKYVYEWRELEISLLKPP